MSVQIDGRSTSRQSNSWLTNVFIGTLAGGIGIWVLCAALSNTAYATWLLFAGIFKTLTDLEAIFCLFTFQAFCGLVVGLAIGYMRAVVHFRWRFGEKSIGTLISPSVLKWFPNFIENYRMFLPHVLVTLLVGYGVGVFMNLSGVPYPPFHSFTGPAIAYLNAGGGGGGDAFVHSSVGFLLFTVIVLAVLLGTLSGITFHLVLSLLVGAIGSGIKGAWKEVGTALYRRDAPSIENGNLHPLTFKGKVFEGAFTGFIVSLTTGFIFVANAGELDIWILLALCVFIIPFMGLMLDATWPDPMYTDRATKS